MMWFLYYSVRHKLYVEESPFERQYPAEEPSDRHDICDLLCQQNRAE